jgi:hypothetical protein
VSDPERLVETVTLSQAKTLIRCAAHEQSFLLLSPPGVGKSDIVRQAAAEAGLECRSLLGTQIAPEDVSGIPRIVGERSVFCPPRVLLPETNEPFCLFLDELPACPPDIQKAFYSLLLERRIGEHKLPQGTWVVAAGNRSEDRALVRTISSALVNRVVILQIRIDLAEWVAWAALAGVRREIIGFVVQNPEMLLRTTPDVAGPFSTPRAWASLSRAIDLAEQAGVLDEATLGALTAGRVSHSDAEPFRVAWNIQRSNHGGPQQPKEILERPVYKIGLSERAASSLVKHGVHTVADLLKLDQEKLASLPEFDRARMAEVQEALSIFGLKLPEGLR